MIGQIIGNYKIEEKLGEGGMGAVYKGVDTMLDREVAIKALKPELASQTSVVDRFRSEAVTLAKLNHPNIATLYTMFRQGEELYMVLEFVVGETLDGILQRRGALPAEEAIPVFCQVLDGIDHAHELGIVHRDIKPANMMLTEKGILKVLDFGIARLLGSARMTRAGNIIGTLEYMAPEQVKGQETDGRSDIYALGMMLYEVLTGKLPFETENEFELMKLQTEVMPASPREINADIPEEVEAAIMRAIQKDPDQRFQTAGEMRDMLLEAGFGTQGAIHGLTGNYQRLNTHPSRPPVSKRGTAPSSSGVETENIIKQTRLGAAPSEVKATRLGTPAVASEPKPTRLGVSAAAPNQPEETGQSFLAKLTPVHYIGAGVAALFLIGLVIIVPAMFLLSSGGDAPTEPKQQEVKNVQSAPEKPAAVESQPAVPLELEPAKPLDTGGDLKPVEDSTAAKPPVSKPVAEKPKTVAPKPAAPKPAPPKSGQKPSAECILTGKC